MIFRRRQHRCRLRGDHRDRRYSSADGKRVPVTQTVVHFTFADAFFRQFIGVALNAASGEPSNSRVKQHLALRSACSEKIRLGTVSGQITSLMVRNHYLETEIRSRADRDGTAITAPVPPSGQLPPRPDLFARINRMNRFIAGVDAFSAWSPFRLRPHGVTAFVDGIPARRCSSRRFAPADDRRPPPVKLAPIRYPDGWYRRSGCYRNFIEGDFHAFRAADTVALHLVLRYRRGQLIQIGAAIRLRKR